MARRPAAPNSPSEEPASSVPPPQAEPQKEDSRTRIIDALMELAGERTWDDFTIADVAERAGVSLSTFRDHFPSKGAVLSGFVRRIDKIVLDGSGGDLAEESPKERLFDVLMRRLDALQPYRHGVEGILDWTRSEPIAAAALNPVVVNSMRFMLVTAGIDVEGNVGMIRTQGLALAWTRILGVWIGDADPGLAKTMAAVDKELDRGGRFMERVQDIQRVTSPLRTLARAVFASRGSLRDRMHERWPRGEETDLGDGAPRGRGTRDL